MRSNPIPRQNHAIPQNDIAKEAIRLFAGLSGSPAPIRIGVDLGLGKTLLLPILPRKEVIQPHLPIRLPCYDFTPVIGLTFGGWLR